MGVSFERLLRTAGSIGIYIIAKRDALDLYLYLYYFFLLFFLRPALFLAITTGYICLVIPLKVFFCWFMYYILPGTCFFTLVCPLF